MKRWIHASEEVENNIGEAIINAWAAALKECDLQEEDVHELTYDEVKNLEKVLEKNLRDRKVDLSFKSYFIPNNGEGFAIQGMKVGGNTGAIANTLIRGCNKIAWTPIPNQKEAVEYIEYAADQGNKIYMGDKFGYCVPISEQKAYDLIGAGNTTQYSGYGSQSYIDVTTVTVYEDYFGNIKVNRSTLRYD